MVAGDVDVDPQDVGVVVVIGVDVGAGDPGPPPGGGSGPVGPLPVPGRERPGDGDGLLDGSRRIIGHGLGADRVAEVVAFGDLVVGVVPRVVLGNGVSAGHGGSSTPRR